MEVEFTVYCLLSDAFSYVVSTDLLQAEYENPCLIT